MTLGNLPKLIAYGFHLEVAQQYRFCFSCLKKSYLYHEAYDAALQNFYVRKLQCDFTFPQAVIVHESYVLGGKLSLNCDKKVRKASYAVVKVRKTLAKMHYHYQLPLQHITPSLNGRCSIGSELGTPFKSLAYRQQLASVRTPKTPIGKPVDITYMPPSINKVGHLMFVHSQTGYYNVLYGWFNRRQQCQQQSAILDH